MATGVGMGFDLEGLDKAIKNAEKGFENLIKTGQRMEYALTQNFRNVAEQGVGVFVSKLNEAQKFLSNIGYNKGIKEMATDMTKVVDEVNKVAVAINNMGQTRRVVDIDIDIAHAVKKLEGLQERGSSDFASYIEGLTQKPIEQEQLSAFYRAEEHRAKENAKREENLNRERLKWAKETDDAEAKLEQGKIKRINKRFDTIERREANQRKEEQAKLNTTQGSLASYNRLYSPQGVRSLNQMKTVLKQLETAQANINTATKEGQEDWKQLGDAIKRVKGDIERLNTRAKSFGDIMKKVGYSVGVYFSISAMKNFGKKLVDVTKEFERQKVALQNLLQNKDEANRLWEKTVALAIKSPYTTQQLVAYTKQLAAYRIEHDKLYETTKMLADVSSGLGVEMNRMILAFGQVKAATYLRATELRQFTEAGVNMLDELARLYTELEGIEVKAGDVFERITKRQVVFSDVEEVFERLTSKGGMFFRMQETQAQTLYGQWANLRDIYQVSLDEMGRSVRGGMVFVISTLRTLVENWRLVATAIESVGVAWAFIKVGNWIATLKKADRTARLLTVTFGRLQKAMLSWQGALGVIGVLTAVLYNYFSNLSQVNQRYVDLRRGTIDSTTAFEQLANQVEENNKTIEKYNESLKDSTKKEEEISNIQKERNNVISENNKLLAEAKNKYEDLLPYIQENANGTLDFDKAVQVMQNRQRAYLILQQKAKAGLFTDALNTNIGDWRKEYNEAEDALIEYQTKLNDAIAKGKRYELFGDQLVDLQELYTYIKDVKSIEEFEKALSNMPEGLKTFAMYNKYAKDLRSELGDVVNDFSKVSSFFVENAHVVAEALDGIDKELTMGVGEASEAEQKKAGEAFDKLLERLGIVDDDVIRKIHEYVNNISREKFGIVLDFEYKTEDEKSLLDWQNRYNDFIEKITEGKTIAGLRKISSFEIETDSKIRELDELIKEQENIINRGNTKGQQRYTPKEIAEAEKLLAVYKEARDWFGKNTKEQKKEDSEELKRLKEKIKFVRQLADDYEEMWKKYGKAYADANIKSAARRDAATELELDLDSLQVGGRDKEIANLKTLIPEALGIENGKLEVDKATADVEVKVKWDIQQQNDDAFKRELEGLFGDYEISMELDKLNIPKDAIKTLFDVEPIELPEVRVKGLAKAGLGSMANLTDEAILASQAYKDLNETQQKELANHLKKVSEMEREAQEDRLKKYIAFARGAVSERAKIKLDELNKLAEIEKTFKHEATDTEQQRAEKDKYKKLATKQAHKEASDALQKLDWEAFKSSDTFNMIFDDLEHAGTESLQLVIDKLKAFKDQWKDMPFDQMRQVVDLLQKAEEALVSESNPFKEMVRLKKAIGEDGRTQQQATSDLARYENAIKLSDDDLARYESFRQIQSGISDSTKLSAEEQEQFTKWTNLSADAQRMLIEGKTIERDQNIQNAQAAEKQLTNLEKLKKNYDEQVDAISKINQMAQDLHTSFEGLHEALGGDKDSPAAIFASMGMSMTDSVAQTIMLTLQLQKASEGATAFGVAMNTALGVVGWINLAVSVLSTAINAFTQAHDNKRERQIQKEIKLVDQLSKLYDKLEKSIESAYTFDSFQAANNAAKENIEQQNQSIQRMIETEEDKKDTDHKRIEEWREQIEGNLEMLEELEAKRLQELGGIGGESNYKAMAESFTDAWLEAYKETGDGLSALESSFEEFINNLIKKQLAMNVAGALLAPLQGYIDESIANDGIFDANEFNRTMELAKEIFPDFNDKMKQALETMGATDWVGQQGELGGLQAGIQGITAEQSDILASYLNSIRFFVADSNTQLKALVAAQEVNADTPNPMLSQLLVIAEQTRSIRDMFESVIGRGGNNKHGGAYLKVDIG